MNTMAVIVQAGEDVREPDLRIDIVKLAVSISV
jgi:hypothetical protein